MEAVVRALTKLIQADEELETARECRVDTSGAPECIQELVRAMCAHGWDVQLGDYGISGGGSERVSTLGVIFEILDLEHELEDTLAQAGADGGPLDPDATLQLGPDGGGMSTLGLSWSGGKLSFCVVEMEEDPSADGLLKHFNTPGALFEYLDNYLDPDDDDGHVAALKAAAIAAGEPMEPAAPVVSKGPGDDVSRIPQPPRPPVQVVPSLQSVMTELHAAILSDSAPAVDAALRRLEGPISNPSLLLPEVFAAFYNPREAHPMTALRVAHWLAQQPAPEISVVRDEWLKGLSGGCELACKPGDEALRYEIVTRAIPQAPNKHDILHNAACALAALGKPEEALAAIEQAAALGYAALEHLRTDTDVVPVCGQEAVDAAIARGKASS